MGVWRTGVPAELRADDDAKDVVDDIVTVETGEAKDINSLTGQFLLRSIGELGVPFGR